jgi:hypothetical protein
MRSSSPAHRARGLKKEAQFGEPRSFSPMFNVAASRPAQMTTEAKTISREADNVNAAFKRF